MTRAPLRGRQVGIHLGRDFKVFDTTIGARLPQPAPRRAMVATTRCQETADNVAAQFGSREAIPPPHAPRKNTLPPKRLDSADEILPIVVPTGPQNAAGNGGRRRAPAPRSDFDSLPAQALAPGGVVTAGNASGINDGVVALLIGKSMAAGEKAGWCRSPVSSPAPSAASSRAS